MAKPILPITSYDLSDSIMEDEGLPLTTPHSAYSLTETYDQWVQRQQPTSSGVEGLPLTTPRSAYSLTETYDQSWVQRQQPTNSGQGTPSGSGLKRHGTRKVKLEQGTVLSIDYPVPSAIKNAVQPRYSHRDNPNEEFSKMRYTAVTCDPNDFTRKNGYDLRPNMYNRHTELFVGVTYYNEDKVLFCRTYHSVMQNVRDIINLKKSSFWNKGGPAWQKIVLCVVMDGIEPCDKGVLDTLGMVGIYQDGILKKDVDGKETVAHVFEYTTQLSATPHQQLIRPTDDSPSTLPPLQVILCLKTKNGGKINSNRWLYAGFGRILNPEIVVHVDTGTKVGPRSLLALWEAFYNDKDLGGACGVIYPMLGRRGKALLNPLVAAQNFEYIVAYQLERALESTTGYLSVLPGAFSAYRFRAIAGRPLEEYFHGDPTLDIVLGKKGVSGSSLMRLNRFLADDRILCSELVSKAGQKWHTRLITSAVGETDIPTSTIDFINQRRRWLNGSLSASIYSLRMTYLLTQSGHNLVRILLLYIQLLYNVATLFLAWFSLAGFLLTTFVVNDITGDPPPDAPVDGFPFGTATPIVNAVIQIVYLATVVFQFILALGGRAKSHAWSYFVSFWIFAIVQVYLLMNLIYLTKRLVDFKTDTNGGGKYGYINEYYSDIGSVTVFATAISAFGIYIAAGIICLNPWHLFTSWAQYLFVSTSYVNILKVYAFSNIHDATWGRKSGKTGGVNDIPVPMQPSGTATKHPSGEVTVEEIDRPQADIDDLFEALVRRALQPYKEEEVKEVDTREDTFLRFRTSLVAVYIFSNFLLCIIVMNDSFQQLWWLGDSYWHKIWFFRIWMWGNSGLLMMQFVGCVYQRVAGLGWCLFARR
ncbi:chitin synthase 1 [Podospora australis]|uniref:Chitin synthase n=1 Tax=Podospora australis TaxID=1536484 RepID=A0AAN6WLL6_9PEZI|nr:chitin synthase 1 [Podospora australis]